MGFHIGVKVVGVVGAVLCNDIGHFISRAGSRDIAFRSGEEAESVTVDGIDAVAHVGNSDGLTRIDDYDCAVGDIVGTDHIGSRVHAEIDSEVEAVSGGKILVSIFLDGVSAGEILGADLADKLDLGCEIAARVIQDKGVGFHIGVEVVGIVGAVLRHGVGEVVVRGHYGIFLESERAGPVCLVRSTILKEEDSADGVGVLATVVSLFLFENLYRDETLLDVQSSDSGLPKYEVAVLGNCLERHFVALLDRIDLADHGLDGSTDAALAGRVGLRAVVRVGLERAEQERRGGFGLGEPPAVLRMDGVLVDCLGDLCLCFF